MDMEINMRTIITTIFLFLCYASTAMAGGLVIPSGSVLGSDGKVYPCMSPPEEINRIKIGMNNTDRATGIHGNNLFVVFEGVLVCVDIKELIGKQKETQIDIITEVVIDEFLVRQAQGDLSEYEASLTNEEMTRIVELAKQAEEAATEAAREFARNELREILESGDWNAKIQSAIEDLNVEDLIRLNIARYAGAFNMTFEEAMAWYEANGMFRGLTGEELAESERRAREYYNNN